MESNLVRTSEINNFINNTIYSDLTFNDKVELALTHLNNMMTDLDYLEMVDSYSTSISFAHPWMIELFKELATEIGLKVVKNTYQAMVTGNRLKMQLIMQVMVIGWEL